MSRAYVRNVRYRATKQEVRQFIDRLGVQGCENIQLCRKDVWMCLLCDVVLAFWFAKP